jgi:shikimate dehydrogenase
MPLLDWNPRPVFRSLSASHRTERSRFQPPGLGVVGHLSSSRHLREMPAAGRCVPVVVCRWPHDSINRFQHGGHFMVISGSTDVFLVVADPVAQVKAPELYNLLFSRSGIDAVCVPARVAPAHLGHFVRTALAVGNFRGLFVSIPHKTPLMKLLDRFDAGATAAGAVNAVRRAADGQLEGGLFDGAGFVASMDHHHVAVQDRRVLMVGAGGAGLAIAMSLASRPLAGLEVFDAQADRAAELIARSAAHAKFPVAVAASADPAGFDIVINATPLGLRPGDVLPFDPARLTPGAVVMDILMTRTPTALLEACRQRCLRAFSGHEMLIQQVPAYLDFFGYSDLASRLRVKDDALMLEVRHMMVSSLETS